MGEHRQAPARAPTPELIMARGPHLRGGDAAIQVRHRVVRHNFLKFALSNTPNTLRDLRAIRRSQLHAGLIIAGRRAPYAEVAGGVDGKLERVLCKCWKSPLTFTRAKVQAFVLSQASHGGCDDSEEQRQAEAEGPGLEVYGQRKRGAEGPAVSGAGAAEYTPAFVRQTFAAVRMKGGR